MTQMRFTITGMSCERCVESVRCVLIPLIGITGATVRVGEADVTFDGDRCAPVDVVSAIRRAGRFDVTGFVPIVHA